MGLIALQGSPDDVALVEDSYRYDAEAEKRGEKGEYLGKTITYWCESCGNPHHGLGLTVNGVPYKGGPTWEWNGRLDAGLVLQPSQLHRSYRYPNDGSEADKAEFAALEKSFDALTSSRFRLVCHTFIGINGAPPGHITWLGDCFRNGAPAPLCGQVRPLLARKSWPGEQHGRIWAKLYEEGISP